jgi:GT2 family glycosyltransferase
MSDVDVVVVSYNNRDSLRENVEPLLEVPWVHLFVVDSASPDETLDVVRDLPLTAIQLPDNRGFAHGVNTGWRAGSAPYVLLLNPDARMDSASLATLVHVLEDDLALGAVAPKIVATDGALEYSQRRYPRLRSTFAQALFLHRLFPEAPWTDELVRDHAAYENRGTPDWVSGACILVRRRALDELGGLDEGFFMYAEDIDFCRRLRDAGYGLLFEPEAVLEHEGGASTPRTSLLPVLASSRLRYAAKHRSVGAAFLERVGIALGSFTHAVVSRGGLASRAGHLRALRAVLSPRSSG